MSDKQYHRAQARACIAMARRFKADKELAGIFAAKILPHVRMGHLCDELNRLNKIENAMVADRGGLGR